MTRPTAIASIALVTAIVSLAGCGSGSSGSGAADGGGQDSTAPSDTGSGADEGPEDSTVPNEDAPLDTGGTDTGTTVADTGVLGSDSGRPLDSGTHDAGDGGVIHSACAPSNVFIQPYFNVTGGGGSEDNAAGDLNNDGLTDLVTIGTSGGVTFTVTLNSGNGTFAAPVAYSGPAPANQGLALAVADLNGDGYLDVIFSSAGATMASGIGVALNKGDGTFGTPTVYDLSDTAGAVQVADINGDGVPDVVVAPGTVIGLWVMLNQGGVLGAPIVSSQLEVDSSARGFDFADFNGDGKLDVAFEGPSGVCVADGMGNGSFGAPGCGGGPSSSLQFEAIQAGDMNGDGKPDVVLWNYGTTTDAADVYLNLGNGSFGTYKSLANETGGIYDGRLADMNNDGKLDVLLFSDEGSLFVQYGNGDGTFGLTGFFTLGGLTVNQVSSDHIVLGDFLGNGLTGVANAYRSGGFEVMPASCRVTVPAPAPVLPPSSVPKSTCAPSHVTLTPYQTTSPSATEGAYLAAADLNGDGKSDLVWLGASTGSSARFSYQLSNGDGTFKPAVEVPGPGSYGVTFQVGDMNSDGKPDVVYATADGPVNAALTVALNTGSAFNLLPPVQVPTPFGANPGPGALADVNNDGVLDAFEDGFQSLGRGGGYLDGPASPTQFSTNNLVVPYVFADFNGDNQLDEANAYADQATNTQGFCFSLNVGSGNFGNPNCSLATVPLSSNMGEAGSILLGDVNNDGKSDVVVLFASSDSNSVYTWLGNGDGTFKPPVTTTTADAELAALADINNDGKLDLLVWLVGSPATTAVLLGNGDGTFGTTGQSFTMGEGANGVKMAVGDFAGNGLSGFAMLNLVRGGIDVVVATCQ